jgi:hypothetical protein
MMRFLILLMIGSCYFSALSAQDQLEAGAPSPEWVLQKEDSSLLKLDAVDAEHILMIFWHYKCGHCHNALDKIDRFLEKEQPDSFKIVSIYPFLSDQDKFWEFVKNPEHLLTDPIYIHTTDYQAMTRRAFGLKGSPPLLVLLKKDGTIVDIGFKAGQLRKIWRELKED